MNRDIFNSMLRNHTVKYIFLFSTFITSQFTWAQPVSNYINHTSEWSIYGGGADQSNNLQRKYYRYFISGDTTIGSFAYFKLQRQGIDSIIPLNGNPPTVQPINDYAGALREDLQKKLYFIYPNQSAENLLYDFGLNFATPLANTLTNQGCNVPPLMLQNIDQVFLGTTPLSRYRTNSFISARITEGIGGEQDFIEPGNLCGVGIEHNSYLLCYKKDNNLLTVNNVRPCGLTVAAGGPDCQARFCYNAKDTLGGVTTANFMSTSSSKDSIVSYSWNLGDGIHTGNVASFNHLYASPGTFVVSLTIRTASGCTSTILDTLKKQNTCNGGITAIGRTTGVAAADAEISPNIIRSYATISTKNLTGKSMIRFYDLTGRKVREITLQAPSTTFYRDGLNAGVYIYHVMHKGRTISTGKIIIQ
jgi:hypothetical protein